MSTTCFESFLRSRPYAASALSSVSLTELMYLVVDSGRIISTWSGLRRAAEAALRSGLCMSDLDPGATRSAHGAVSSGRADGAFRQPMYSIVSSRDVVALSKTCGTTTLASSATLSEKSRAFFASFR